MKMKLDNSKRSSFASCPRKYYLRYIHHLTSEYGSTALRFGSTWHALMEGYYQSVKNNGWGGDHLNAALNLAQEVWNKESEGKEFYEDYRTLENCFESFIHYLSEFKSDEALKDIIATERIFDIVMQLTAEEKELYPFLSPVELHFTGKLDLEVSLSGQHWIEEFKSTGQGIQQQADRLQRSAQLLGYTWAGKQLGNDVVGALVSIHQITSRRVKAGGYGKITRNFLRQPNVFSDADLNQWRKSFLYTANAIAEAREKDNFPCQYDSCYQFGKCGFTNICEQNRPLEDCNLQGYIKEEWDVLKSGASKEEVQVITKTEEWK